MLINKTPTLYLSHQQKQENIGRFPANLIHDNSEEVRECFPETKSTIGLKKKAGENSGGKNAMSDFYNHEDKMGGHNDSGNASRFFKSIIYQAKSSKSERTCGGTITNQHPTIKPIALMEYLIKMMTREGQIVLDPFGGSGTTGVACKNTNRNYILIEKDEGYCDVIEKRLDHPILP